MTYQEFMTEYQIRLSRQQEAAVRSVDGPLLLLAVPGGGKTTTLVTRLGYMVCCRDIAPEEILTLTYTVAATRDMGDRFEAIFGEALRSRMEFRTINGVCARIIHRFSAQAGKEPFRLLTDEKQIAAIISGIYRRTEPEYPTDSDIRNVRTLIAYIKNMRLSDIEIRKLEQTADCHLQTIYAEYCRELRAQGLMDYDDQLVYALNILKKSPELLAAYQQQYRYICVDEAQDTSKIQHEIIRLLAAGHENLFMVGDEDQSIYGFRAAYPEALLSFEQDHPGAKVLLMEENYRSNASIVDAAARFIRRNRYRHEKDMRAARPKGTAVRILDAKARRAQNSYLLKVAENCTEETAVLYRDHENILPLVDLLERKGIPYRMRQADLSFFTNRVVNDLKNIIHYAMDPGNTELFLQVYYKLSLYLKKQDALEAAELAGSAHVPPLDALIAYSDLPAFTKKNLKAIRTHLAHLLTDSGEAALDRIENRMGYGEYLDRSGLGRGRLYSLRCIAAGEKSPAAYLDRMELLRTTISEKEPDPDCRFILSTIHSSKGLEYDTVYLMDVMDGLFPEHIPDAGCKDQEAWKTYEEERRLFYVGITRAKENLNIFRLPAGTSFAEELLEKGKRTGTGNTDAVRAGRSGSAAGDKSAAAGDSELDRKLKRGSRIPEGNLGAKVRLTEPSYLQKREHRIAPSHNGYDRFVDSLGEGILVCHKRFGEGVVLHLTEETVMIRFPDKTRSFLLERVYENALLKVLS